MSAEIKNPNIIIVMTDQQRYDLRKSCGYSLDTMPFLDSFAKTGVDFANAYTSNPTCMPARVSMFTGRYPSAHAVRTNHNREDAIYSKDLFDVLKARGYKLALCGKNHSHRDPSEYDFHETNGHLGHEDEINRNKEEQDFSDFLAKLGHTEYHKPSPGGIKVQFPYRNVTSCFKFIDECTNKKPFFAWVSMAEPHNPNQVPEPYFDMFPPEMVPENKATCDDLKNKPDSFIWLREVWEKVLGQEISDKRIARFKSNYLGMLRLIDDQLKRLIKGLKERKLIENTIVVFLSDHGDFVGEYGLIRKGGDVADVLSHIPMIWAGPGIAKRGKDEEYFVNIVDVFPTICDLIGEEIPYGCQGKSIQPLLANKNIPEKEFDLTYCECGYGGMFWNKNDSLTLSEEGASKDYKYLDCLNSWTQSGQVRMLRKGDYKIQMDMMGRGFLYNISTDPMELDDLWENESYKDIKFEMLKELMAMTLRMTDLIPAPHHRLRVKRHNKGYWFDDFSAPDPGVQKDSYINTFIHCE